MLISITSGDHSTLKDMIVHSLSSQCCFSCSGNFESQTEDVEGRLGVFQSTAENFGKSRAKE